MTGGIRSLGTLTMEQAGDILGQAVPAESGWKPVLSDVCGIKGLRSMSIAPIRWPRMMPIEGDTSEVWMLAAKCSAGSAFSESFWNDAEWLVVPLASLDALSRQSAAEGCEVHASWVVWGEPEIESIAPLSVYPALLVDLDYESDEPPEVEAAARDIFAWLEAMRGMFPRQQLLVEFTGGKGAHLILNEWDASSFSADRNPLSVYSELRHAMADDCDTFRPDPIHQMSRVPASLYGYRDATPWCTSVVAAEELETAQMVERHLLRAWSDSGYWGARKRETNEQHS